MSCTLLIISRRGCTAAVALFHFFFLTSSNLQPTSLLFLAFFANVVFDFFIRRFKPPHVSSSSLHQQTRNSTTASSVRSRTANICPQRITSWTTQGTRAPTGGRRLRMQDSWRKLTRRHAYSFTSMHTHTPSLVPQRLRYGMEAKTI